MNNLFKSLITMLPITLLISAAVCGGGGSSSGGPGGGNVVNDFRSVSAGQYHCVVVSRANIYVWGWNDELQLGLITYDDYQINPLVLDDICDSLGGCHNQEPYNMVWRTASAGGYHSLAIGDYYDKEAGEDFKNTFWGWGQACWGQLPFPFDGMNLFYYPVSYGRSTKFIAVSAGEYHSAAINEDGELWLGGSNDFYEVGWCPTCEDDEQWVIDPDKNHNWKMVSAGKRHTLAIKNDGSLWGWGDNFDNQIGIENTEPDVDKYWELQQVGADHKWEYVSAGHVHSAGITTNGELYAWGWGNYEEGDFSNDYGYLGNGTRYGSKTPLRIGTDNDWKMVSVGREHTVALKTDGRLFMWGPNNEGQLGTGVNDIHYFELSPVEMKPGTRWMLADAGYDCTIAMTEMGHVWGWGSNYYFQLSNGTDEYWSNVPVEIDLVSGGK